MQKNAEKAKCKNSANAEKESNMGNEPGVQVFKARIPQGFRFFKLEFLSKGYRFLRLEFLTGYSSRTCILDMGCTDIKWNSPFLWLHIYKLLYIYIYMLALNSQALVIPETLTTSKLSRSLRQLTLWVI